MSAVAFRANVISSRDQALHIIIPGAAGPGVVYVVAGSGAENIGGGRVDLRNVWQKRQR